MFETILLFVSLAVNVYLGALVLYPKTVATVKTDVDAAVTTVETDVKNIETKL